jgi:hypothetical protein
MKFNKNNPKLCWNYKFAPLILHLGPCIRFIIMIRSLLKLILVNTNYRLDRLSLNHHNFLTVAPI